MIPKIYLAGPIDNCDDGQIHDWRENLKVKYMHNALFIDPCRRIDMENINAKLIVDLDKADITLSDVVLANCWKPGWGTAQEIIWSFERGKIVVAIVPDIKNYSAWIHMHTHFVAESTIDGMNWVLNYFNKLYCIEDDFDSYVRNC